MDTHPKTVSEMQGLYGPFTIAERVLQKIWLRRDFESGNLRLLDGQTLHIRSAGSWNLLGGPDFRAVRLAISDTIVTGDVEVHFHVSDWHAHRHAEDPAYDNVVLHVVLFPPGAHERMAQRRNGETIPTLVLLPLLYRGIEEYVADDAIERLTAQDTIEKVADLARLPLPEVQAILLRQAQARWKLKIRFATLRIERLGWADALHHTALEILGYRRNRSEMMAVATAHPLVEWGREMEPDLVYDERIHRWQLQGVRPANHPRLRLRQYRRWVMERPDWPERLIHWGAAIPKHNPHGNDTASFRKLLRVSELNHQVSRQILAGAVAGPRLDTLICDGFLPFLAVKFGREDFALLWFHWFAGDVPDELRKVTRILGIAGDRAAPFCHGWIQGFLGWLSLQELRTSN